MTDTPLLQITEVAPTQTAKETTINDAIVKLEGAFNDMIAVNMTGGSVTLTSDDYTSYFCFDCVGHTTTRNFIVPSTKRLFAVRNSGTAAVTIKTASAGTTEVLGAGSTALLFNDGTNDIILLLNTAGGGGGGGGGATAFTDLSDAPGSYAASAMFTVRVNASDDGLEFHRMDLTDLPSFGTPIANGYLQWNADGTIHFVSSGVAGATVFTGLSDVPNDYATADDDIVTVNPTATGLQFTARDDLLNFTDLKDVPHSYSGQSSKIVQVNLTENGLIFGTLPSLGTIITITTGDANAGFEAGNLTGWTTIVGSSALNSVVPILGAINPYAGSFFYKAEGVASTTLLRRLWNLALLATSAELDNAARVDIPYAFARHNAATSGLLTVDNLDGSGSLISSVTGPTLTGTTDTWTAGTFSVDLPPGTRRINLNVTTSSTSGTISGAWDQLDPVLRVGRAIGFAGGLTDTPANYSGAALKGLRVNAGATAVEFYTRTFIAQADTPSSYVSNAGKVPVVNIGETALAFLPYKLGSLLNVSATEDVTIDGWSIAYNNSTSAWEPVELAIVDITTPAIGEIIAHNGTSFVNSKKADLPAGSITLNGPTTIARATVGEVARGNLTANATLTITGWPSAGQIGKLTLEVTNNGAFGITWPTGSIAPGGTLPTVTSGAGKKDIYLLTTFDGGSTTYVLTVAQNCH